MAKIQKPEAKPNPQKVRFSFEYLQLDHPRFSLSDCTKEFYDALLSEIIRYQNCSIDEFREMRNENKRHPIYFKETTEKEGFAEIDASEEDLWTDEAWQFALPGAYGTPSAGWRVHGFIVGNTFNIVWLDPCHRLDSPLT